MARPRIYKKQRKNVSIDGETHEELSKLAAAHDTTTAQIIREGKDLWKKKHPLSPAALRTK